MHNVLRSTYYDLLTTLEPNLFIFSKLLNYALEFSVIIVNQ